MPIGLDIGTYNIISSTRDSSGEIESKREVNAFLDLPIEQDYMINMLKNSGAPVLERNETAFILGKSAVELAYSMNRDVMRPMSQGILSVSEKEAFNILSVIIKSMIGKVKKDGEIVYFSLPADPVNADMGASYHAKIVQSILDSYKVGGKRLKAKGINEALAIVIAELEKDNRTGIGISFGAGMVNLCYAMFSMPVVQFSRTDAGDWVDRESAKATGETATFINRRKEGIDLSAPPKDSIDRAIMYHYELLIENSLKDISKGIKEAGSKANPGKAVPIVLAGGTASPKGFTAFFRDILTKMIDSGNFPLEISGVQLARDHLYTVSRGCLLAAEAASGAASQEEGGPKPKS